MREIYLDNNATTEPLPEVRAAMMRAVELAWGNPSSAHSGGAAARRLIAESREAVASLIGTGPESVTFVSGGTEANVMALRSCVAAAPERRLITAKIEHSSVVKTAEQFEREGIEVVWLEPQPSGVIEPEQVRDALSRQGAAAVSVQWVNNETGVIHDAHAIAEIAREFAAPFHCDAAQAVGKLPVSFDELPADVLTFTAHKIHGPAGIGAIVIRDQQKMTPIVFGGDQEAGLRPGTENIAGIAGFGVAAEARRSKMSDVVIYMDGLRARFEQLVGEAVPGVATNGGSAPRVCNTSNLRFPVFDGQALMAQLDIAGVRCSQSSACTNSRPEPSYVLRAMGLSEDDAYRSVRFSFSELNSAEEVDAVVEILRNSCARLADPQRSAMPLGATR